MPAIAAGRPTGVKAWPSAETSAVRFVPSLVSRTYTASPAGAAVRPCRVAVGSPLVITYDGSSRAAGVRLYLNGAPLASEVIRDRLFKDITYDPAAGDNVGEQPRLTIAARFRDSGFKNGLAIAGDYTSAATFLGVTALVYTSGYDGMIYAIGFLVGFPMILFLIVLILTLVQYRLQTRWVHYE